MSDLIDRQAAIDEIMALPNCENGYSDTYDKACIIGILEEVPSAEQIVMRVNHELSKEDLEKLREKMSNAPIVLLPSAQPERKTGHWILVNDSNGQHCICEFCGEWKYHQKQKFCGECGARMEAEHDSQ